ncbi:alpha/beta hydrolase family protein [Myxococcus landrumensis]|uniref:Alpha/beta hydrolase family protein n=1 Tax=Myxococcus landrumensis TaxID=2813577 RepID=A0ABX7NEJ0_9BACT|nr:alpha/beta hydrolase family protein [Myxococcus landrumus]QSQ16794.1 alpha/beta hydrolase family protein [Myxococcus landrumus]
MHPLDGFVSSLSSGSLFREGWGDEQPFGGTPLTTLLSPSVSPLEVTWAPEQPSGRRRFQDGVFASPWTALPSEVRQGRVRWLSSGRGPRRDACVVLAASRDEGYRLRTWLFAPLVDEGMDLFFLENPFYGARRATGQRGPHIRTVSEQLHMNIATIEEARGLVSHARRQGYQRVAVAGYSMGGYMAALSAATMPEPVGVAALAAGASPAPVFTKGVHGRSIDFKKLGGSPDETAARHRLATLLDMANACLLPPPLKPGAAIIVACERDGFVPISESRALHAHWAGSELRVLDAGHISAILTSGSALRAALRDAVHRSGE